MTTLLVGDLFCRSSNAEVYYNDNEPSAINWLQELGRAGLIEDGYYDRRSIAHVRSGDVRRYRRTHFFAGIGGWEFALRLANWPENRPVWSGSCPCQPFSQAGQRKGENDKRHVWPHFRRLISECKPATVFGEQVASPDGRKWLSRVRADLEALGYAVGCSDLCAAGVGAPHLRQRLFWVADLSRDRWKNGITPDGLGDAYSSRRPVGNHCGKMEAGRTGPAADSSGFWSRFAVVDCSDGKRRRFEPGSFPLAHGIPGRVGLLRGYGNAIVPQLAAEFIKAFLESEKCIAS